ncbi:hypothetical protein ACM42_16775 [Bradyrhizobium sp. CCBAU 25338]|nr:hypothetical protein [Bradyrhizobium sp. CCBAU 25338]
MPSIIGQNESANYIQGGSRIFAQPNDLLHHRTDVFAFHVEGKLMAPVRSRLIEVVDRVASPLLLCG